MSKGIRSEVSVMHVGLSVLWNEVGCTQQANGEGSDPCYHSMLLCNALPYASLCCTLNRLLWGKHCFSVSRLTDPVSLSSFPLFSSFVLALCSRLPVLFLWISALISIHFSWHRVRVVRVGCCTVLPAALFLYLVIFFSEFTWMDSSLLHLFDFLRCNVQCFQM